MSDTSDGDRVVSKRPSENEISEISVVPLELHSVDLTPCDEWRNSPSPDSPRKHVKSTAVVKYSTVQSLANFAVLQCNTDLNSPPSNWLSSSADSYGLQHVPSHSTGFSSFRMAHMFPECVGEVDVVSDAENIKKLLKIPYSKGPVSMMVHRIENTLLIDEFDIHKYLLRTAESDWEWLKKFFYEHVLQSLNEKEKGLFHKNKSRCALQQKSLVSKFLYHSLAVAQAENENTSEPQNSPSHDAAVPIPVPGADPPLPEPNLEEEVPDPTSNHKFARNVVWTFEDIQMLIGTNLPIFGGKTHPCISLKLRDMTKPINVLTGIDYWLDNLMCNVPELVMCYHLDGIVQKYELIKTEDLPHLENSKFSPKVIRDVAQNILSFLKSNATKAGHTYWLFKGKDAEIVKLYDLTSLCSDLMEDKGQNPFTVPVAMLLYRVARNMKHSPDGQRQQGTIRLLLKNCIELLAKEKYPQIVTSAHYMLSDLYIPADTDPASPNMPDNLDEDGNSEYDEGDYSEEQDNGESETSFFTSSSSVDVKSLCVATTPHVPDAARPPPLSKDMKERCSSALEHVAAGLQCLSLFDISAEDSSQHCSAGFERSQDSGERESEGPAMAKPFEAIPMPYSPLKNKQHDKEEINSLQARIPHSASAPRTDKKRKRDTSSEDHCPQETQLSPRSLLCKYRAEAMPTWQQPKPSDKVFWRAHLKILLHEKACLVYATLAENEYSQRHYGSALRYIGMVLRCQQQLEVIAQGTPNLGLQSYLLGRAGDLCFMIVQNWTNVEIHRQQYAMMTEVDQEVLKEIEQDNSINHSDLLLELIPQSIGSIEQMLLASQGCYQQALVLEPLEQQRSNLRRRLGNIENELGVLYMNQAAVCYQEKGFKAHSGGNSALQALLNKSQRHLESGVQAFEVVHDEANLALLHSNTGRLMRMCAHYHSPDSSSRSELAGLERHFYHKALSSYQKALQVLGNRKCNPNIWDTVMWELSTTLFSMATILQDYPSLGNKTCEETEREVVEYLLKALKYCDLETVGSRQPVYQFRAATIHHRLASLYHRSYRNLPAEDTKRKNILQLSRLHYEKAIKLLSVLEHPSDFLRVQMERVALAEFLAQNATSVPARTKNLQGALELMCQCLPMLQIVQERLNFASEKGKKKSVVDSSSEECKEAASELSQDIENLNLSSKERKPRKDKGASKSYQSPEISEDSVEKEEVENLLHILEQRLQFILLQLTKMHHGRSCQSKKEVENLGQIYKALYSLTLKKGECGSGRELAFHLSNVLIQTEAAISQSPTSSKAR